MKRKIRITLGLALLVAVSVIGGMMLGREAFINSIAPPNANESKFKDPYVGQYGDSIVSEYEMVKSVKGCEVPSMNTLSQRLNAFVQIVSEKGVSTEGIYGVIVELPDRVLIFPEGTRIPKNCQAEGVVWYTPNAVDFDLRTWVQRGFAKPFQGYEIVGFGIRFGSRNIDPTGWKDKDYEEMRKRNAVIKLNYLKEKQGIIPVEDMEAGVDGPALTGSILIKLRPVDVGQWTYFIKDDANIIQVGNRFFIVTYENYVLQS